MLLVFLQILLLRQCEVTVSNGTSNFTILCGITQNGITFRTGGGLSLNRVFRVFIFLKNAGGESTSSVIIS